jgi:hypothetical protein
MEQQQRGCLGLTLAHFGEQSDHLRALRKTDIRAGDFVLVRTQNSRYVLRALGEGRFEASGGWFDRKGFSGLRTGVTGCSNGGSIIKIDIVVACGLCIEFANRLITTPVKSFAVLQRGWEN